MLIIIVVLGLYCLGCYYVSVRTIGWLSAMLPNFNSWIVWILIGLFSIVIPVLAQAMPENLFSKMFRSAANYWLGICMYTLLVLAIFEIIHLVIKLGKFIPPETLSQPKTIIIVGWIIVAAIVSIVAYGVANAKTTNIAEYSITVEKQANMEEMRIVLLSDIHLGHNIGSRQIKKVVEMVNALDADLICIAGDIYDGDFRLVDRENVAPLFKQLESKYGVYACLGNHDAGPTVKDMLAFLEECEIKLLQDEYLLIEDKFYIGSRNDRSPIGDSGNFGRSDLGPFTANLDKSKPVFLMDHQPYDLQEAEDNGVDLLMCGHTHGGQVFPGNLITNAIYELHWGYKQRNDLNVVVSSGVGLWGPPLRVGTDSEIVSINIKFAP